jgi:hypothetical protein
MGRWMWTNLTPFGARRGQVDGHDAETQVSRAAWVCARTVFAILCFNGALDASPWRVPRTPDGHPDLQGYWTNTTATPLQRPIAFGDQTHFTRVEAEAYEHTWLERLIEEEDEEDRTGADLNEIYLDNRKVVADLRTSLIVDPPTGRIPPVLPGVEAREQARPKGYDDPEARPLGERCLVGLDGGQAVTAPIVPNLFNGNFYRIVQTPSHVMIFAEQIHDARIVRIGGAHVRADL